MNFQYFYELLQENLRKLDIKDSSGNIIMQKDLPSEMANRSASKQEILDGIKKTLLPKFKEAENARKQIEQAKNEMLQKKDMSPTLRRQRMSELEELEQKNNDEVNHIKSLIIRQGGYELLKQILLQSSIVAKNSPQKFNLK